MKFIHESREFNTKRLGNAKYAVVEGEPRRGNTKLIGTIGKANPGQYDIIFWQVPMGRMTPDPTAIGVTFPSLAEAGGELIKRYISAAMAMRPESAQDGKEKGLNTRRVAPKDDCVCGQSGCTIQHAGEPAHLAELQKICDDSKGDAAKRFD